MLNRLSVKHFTSACSSSLANTQPVNRRQGHFLKHHNPICVAQFRHYAKETIMNVFDRNAKRIQKNRTALNDDYKVYEYIREDVGWRMADRIFDVKRKFEVAVDLGCWRGHIGKHVFSDSIGTLFHVDMAEKVLEQSEVSPEFPTYKVQADEEYLPFKKNCLDLVVSSLSLHWVNNLPGAFKQINDALKPDGCFIGCMFGAETLYELRVSLQLAEQELEGGFGPHISPFITVQDLGDLLGRAGYKMVTIDIDEIVVNYPGITELMQDLKGMGENNASWSRKAMLHRATQARAAEIYKKNYASEDGSLPATFNIIFFIGWKPDPSQKKSAARGSATASLKDLDKLDQLSKNVTDLKSQSGEESIPDSERYKVDGNIEKISKDIERLRQSTMTDTDGKEKS